MYSLLKKIYFSIETLSIPNTIIPYFFVRKVFWLVRIIQELYYQTCRILFAEPIAKSYCKYVGKNVYIEKIPYINGIGHLNISDDVHISGKIGIAFNQKIYPSPQLSIGAKTFVGHNCSFSIAQKIIIGEHCYLAGGVRIMDNDGHPLDYIERRENRPVHKQDVKPVIIGNDVWIGKDATILKGVTICDRAIIGAGSIVVKDIDADSIAGGNPAKIIRGQNVRQIIQ